MSARKKKKLCLCKLIMDVIAVFHWEEASHPASLSLREETMHSCESQMLTQNHLTSLSTTMRYVDNE